MASWRLPGKVNARGVGEMIVRQGGAGGASVFTSRANHNSEEIEASIVFTYDALVRRVSRECGGQALLGVDEGKNKKWIGYVAN